MKKKLLSMLLAAVMVLSVTACGQAENVDSSAADAVVEESAEAGEIVYPLGAEDKTIKIAMMSYHFKIAGDVTDIADTHFWEQYQKNVGVNLEIEMFETEDAFNLMLAGGDLPDIIMWAPSLTNGDAAGMIEDEIITTLTWEELDQYAPNYAARLRANDIARKMLTIAANGEIVGFGNWNNDQRMRSTNGMIVRGDWMDELGIENPTTPEEFLDMLRAFKNEKGAEYPMALTSHRMNLLFGYGFFSSPYGLINGGDYVVDGKYEIGYYQPEYKEYLKLFHTMYEEGLINPDYLTLEQTVVDGMLYDGRTGCVQQSVIAGLGNYIPAMEEVNPEAELRGIPSLLGPNGEKAFYGATEGLVGAFKGMITTACEDKALAMKVLNYGFTEEGGLFMQFGTEGVSYEMVDGVPTYLETITKNENGFTMGQMLHQYCRAGAFWPNNPMYEYFVQTTSHPIQRAAVAAWDDNDRYVYMTPDVAIADEDLSEYSRISTDVSTYSSEMRAKFISGELDIDAEFDNYIQGLQDRGIDTMIEMKQAAIDAFNAL